MQTSLVAGCANQYCDLGGADDVLASLRSQIIKIPRRSLLLGVIVSILEWKVNGCSPESSIVSRLGTADREGRVPDTFIPVVFSFGFELNMVISLPGKPVGLMDCLLRILVNARWLLKRILEV